jgi:hypothetical protein
VIRVAPDGSLSLGTTAQVLFDPVFVDQPAELRYRGDVPFAVSFFLEGVEWPLDRGALGTGHAAGDVCGDVRITRLDGLGVVVVELVPGTSAATVVRLGADCVDEFLAATYDVVPHGAESLDVDGLIRRILERA